MIFRQTGITGPTLPVLTLGLMVVFITHQHEDHIGGLPGLIKSLVKYPVPGQHTTIYLPEPGGIDGTMAFMRATHRGWPADLLSFAVIAPGVFYQDEQVRLTALPTRHLENESMSYPSFGFLIEAEGRRIVYTGDLKADFSDFPASAFTGPTTCICECTHFPLDDGLSILRELPITRLICNHVDNIWHGPEGEAAFHRLTAALPFPVALAHDGDTFDIEETAACFA